jgi:hypothetical protein
VQENPGHTADIAPAGRGVYRDLIVAARFFAERARECEAAALRPHEQRGAGAVRSVRHRSFVTGSILSAVAFLEGSINELYLELHGARASQRGRLPRGVLAGLGRFWSHVEHAPLLQRYQIVLTVADAERFDERRAPFQDVDTLIKLRDALVHCGPERPASRRRLRTIEQRLHPRFATNPLAADDSPWFPDVCLSSECAEWAVQAADAFSDEFCRRISLPGRGLERSDADARTLAAQARSRSVLPNSDLIHHPPEPNGASPGDGR